MPSCAPIRSRTRRCGGFTEAAREAWRTNLVKARAREQERRAQEGPTPYQLAALAKENTTRSRGRKSRRALTDEDLKALRATAYQRATVKGPECAYCLTPNPTTIDHVIPLALGGTDDEDNRVPCCFVCNAAKGRRDPWTWLEDGLMGSRERL